MAERPYLVTTEHKGVFAGLVDEDTIGQSTLAVRQAKMAIYWGTDKGVMQLAQSGPTSKSRISAPADIPVLHNVTAVFEVTDEAWAKWLKS
jgi:hypothetical protein